MSIISERLNKLDTLTLLNGGHSADSGKFCFNEAAAWLAGEPHTDAPACVSRYLRNYTMRLNDRWDDEKRQTLLPYLPRVIGTGDDGKDPIRQKIAAQALCRDLLPPWLRLAKLDDMAAKVEAAADLPYGQMVQVIREARDAGWVKRRENVEALKIKVREELAKRGGSTAAVAAAVAVAVAAAAAVADADAAAVAAAVADADAVAVAAAAAAAAADAAAVAAAAAVADGEDRYWAAYKAARAYYREHPLAVGQEIADLATSQNGTALALLDRLITAEDPS